MSLIAAAVKDLRGMDHREVFAVTPCDANIEAIRVALERDCTLEFIDCELRPAHLASRSCVSDPDWPDDSLVLTYGVDFYLDMLGPRLSQPPARSEPIATWREHTLARRLQELKACFRRILVACDAVHVKPVLGLLRSGTILEEEIEENPPRTRYYMMQPEINILLRYLDDFPRLVYAYENARLCGTAADFDKRAELLRAMIRTKNRLGDPASSPRQFAAFSAYLSGLTRLNHRFAPRPDDVFHALKGCFSPEFAENVQMRLLKYGNQIRTRRIASVSIDSEPTVMLEQKVANSKTLFVNRNCNPNSKFCTIKLVRKKEPDPGTGLIHGWAPQERYINRLRQSIYMRLKETETRFKSVPFNGSIESGVEPRRTLQSFWRRRPAIYVKHPVPCALPTSDDHEPIVWILDPREEQGYTFTPWLFGGLGTRYCSWLRYATNRLELHHHSPTANLTVKSRTVKGYVLFCDAAATTNQVKSVFGDDFEKRVPKTTDLVYGLPRSISQQFNRWPLKWWERLLVTALHYAEQGVVCILPGGCTISREIEAYARSHKKRFFRLPETSINHKERRLIGKNYVLEVPGHDEQNMEIKDPAWLAHLTDQYSSLMRQFWHE